MTRLFMRQRIVLLMAAVALAGAAVRAQQAADIPFDGMLDTLKTPDNITLGEVAGVATNSKGDIIVYTRVGHPTASLGGSRTFVRSGSRLFMFDKTGKYIREIGQE